MAYEYEPLISRNNEIRILKLFPSPDQSAEICCELETVSLSDNPYYTALSYCWADPPDARTMLLHGQKKEVTGNLYAALCSLRDKEEACLWWIDALCINQDDLEERSLQVLRMTAIYQTAFRVVAWIGSETPGQPSLQQLLESQKAQLETGSQPTPDITQLHDLLSRKYWRRIWVVQEISVATDVQVVCGSSSVSWDFLCEVIRLFERAKDSCGIARVTCSETTPSGSRGVSRSNDQGIEPSTLETGTFIMPKMTAPRPVELSTTDGLVKSYEGLQTLRDFRTIIAKQTPLGLFEALTKTSSCLATDGRDKIYALIGLVHDGRAFVPVPDYKININELKVQMARNILQATKNLDVIIACGHRQVLDGSLPSWTPDWFMPGFEAKYVFARDSEDKFKASGDSVWISTAERGNSTCIRAEYLRFAQVDGLSTVYGNLATPSDGHESLVQPRFDSSPDQPPRLRLACLMQKVLPRGTRRNETLLDLYWCLKMGPPLRKDVRGERLHYTHTLDYLYDHPDSAHNSSYRRWFDACRVKRTFRSLELEKWLDENRNLRLRSGESFQSMCISKAVKHGIFPVTRKSFLLLSSSPVIIVTTATPLLVIFSRTLRVDIGVVGGVLAAIHGLFTWWVFMSIFFICETTRDQKAESTILKEADRFMKERHLRLATTGGSAMIESRWQWLTLLVPGSTRQGDHAVTLKGCSTPVLLRGYKDGFQVIGIAYSDQAMYGEVVNSPTETWEECKLY